METAATFKEWMAQHYEPEELLDIAHYGANTGWQGLTWTTELWDLYTQYKDEIWEVIAELADEYGVHPLQFLADLLKDKVQDAGTFHDTIVWLAAEHYANTLTDTDTPGKA